MTSSDVAEVPTESQCRARKSYSSEVLGDYQVENPDAAFPFEKVRLIEEDNLMYLSYRMPLLSDKQITLPLTALDNNQAITTGLGRGRGETLLAKQTAEGEFLLYSGYLVKKVVGTNSLNLDDL